jgi:hypothetical protein
LTIQSDPKLIQKLDVFRKKRNVTDYERADTVSDLEADGMRELALRLRGEVAAWIQQTHPDLCP